MCVCVAHCQQGCKHGECVGPDRCKCHPGYTGKACNQGNPVCVCVCVRVCVKTPQLSVASHRFDFPSCLWDWTRDTFLSCLFDLQRRVLPEDPQNTHTCTHTHTHTHTHTAASKLRTKRRTPPTNTHTHTVNLLIRGYILSHILTIKQHLALNWVFTHSVM